MSKLIVSNPEILGGKPVVAGTRIPVSLILRLLKDGYTIAAIHDLYPQLPTKTIEGTVNEVITNTDQIPSYAV